MLEEAKRQRAMRPEVATGRTAMAVARPFQNKIHLWQLRTAWTIGMAGRMSERDSRRTALSQDIAALLEEVRSAHLDFSREVDALPVLVASSTRIIDTDRALGSIVSGLEQALELLDDDRDQRGSVVRHSAGPTLELG